jgi:glycosyltransferase involved in cell wall biosynthesis
MRNLKVAIVMPTHFDINSSLNNFIKTYQYLIKKKGLEVTLLTDKKNNVQIKGFNIKKIDGLDYGTVFEKLLLLLGIPRYYYPKLNDKLKGFDVITANNPEFYAYAFQAYKAARYYGSRFILRTSQTVDGFFLFKITKYLIVPIIKKSYDYASYTIFTNPQAEKRCLRLGLLDSANKSIITGHATDTKTFIPSKSKKGKKSVILSVGGLYKIKGHHLIIRALKKVIDSGYTNVELWIVGKGYYESNLRKLVKELNLEKMVKFLGSKGHDELAKIYNISDIFVLANLQEITPAVNEALACNIPVVVMECGGRKLVIPDRSYGLVSKRMDIGDLASNIITLVKDRKLAKKIANKGRKRVLELFSIESVAGKLYRSFTD